MQVVTDAAFIQQAAAKSAAVPVECLALHEPLATFGALAMGVQRAGVLLFALSASGTARFGVGPGESNHLVSPSMIFSVIWKTTTIYSVLQNDLFVKCV